MQTPVNVICMKWGKLYGPEYVNFLRAGVGRHLKRPFRFVCFTDDAQGLRDDVQVLPLPELGLPKGQGDLRWRKLAVFREQLHDLQGSTLFLDLDLVIVDGLDAFFEHPGSFLIIRDDDLFSPKPLRKLNPARDRFLHSVGNSSVFRFEIGQHTLHPRRLPRRPEGCGRALRDLAAVPERAAGGARRPGLLAQRLVRELQERLRAARPEELPGRSRRCPQARASSSLPARRR